MIKYVTIILDDSSSSMCQYTARDNANLMSLDTLHKSIIWSMKENLLIQYVYPSYTMPDDYHRLIASMDSVSYVPVSCSDDMLLEYANFLIVNSPADLDILPGIKHDDNAILIVRLPLQALYEHRQEIAASLKSFLRVNVVPLHSGALSDADMANYSAFLDTMGLALVDEYTAGRMVQVNVLTDRLFLDHMNNCGAGDSAVTIAPDGKIYVCPAFYYDDSVAFSIGDINRGVDIKNPQLYRLSHAPLCIKCDAFQCQRCIWTNVRTTLEVNVPSHEQCVIAHLERRASVDLYKHQCIRDAYGPDKIAPVDYLDPYETMF